MRYGRVLALISAALALSIGGLLLAVFLTRDEDHLQIDNLLAEKLSLVVSESEDPLNGTHGIVDLRQVAPFGWDRVYLVAAGTPAATISRRIGRPWKPVSTFGRTDLLIFMDGTHVARFCDYRGLGHFAGFARPIAVIDRSRAVLKVQNLEIRLRP